MPRYQELTNANIQKNAQFRKILDLFTSEEEALDENDRCKICRRLKKGSSQEFEADVNLDRDVPQSRLTDAEVVAKSGCEFCSMLVSAVTRAHLEGYYGRIPAEEIVFTYFNFGARGMQVRIDEAGAPWKVNHDDFEVYTTSEACPWPEIKLGRTTRGYSGSPERLCLVKKWVEECSQSHPECRQESITLPTRVIDLGHSDTCAPRIISGQGLSAQYCALSHCWGLLQPIRTTKLNFAQMESGIHMSLSRTFRDVITITRSLSVRYLWIDSLCIIQDDHEDWERESAQMATVYENAYLVISAARAADGSLGCFSNQPVLDVGETPFYTCNISDGTTVPIYMRPSFNLSHQMYLSGSEHLVPPGERLPLHSRSWALQERILATRIVHFTREELIWECRQSAACECMYLDRVDDPRGQPLKQLWSAVTRRDNRSYRQKQFGLWHGILRLYTDLELTFPSDRLPALSGLAKRMQGAGAGDYIAGLWKDNLLLDMLWRVHSPSLATRANTWQAPSWSWAGLQLGANNGISHTINMDTETHKSDLLLTTEKRLSPNVVEVYCEAAGEDRTGHVKRGASVTISAAMIPVSATRSGLNMQINKDGKSIDFVADSLADFPEDHGQNKTFDLFCIWIGTEWGRGMHSVAFPHTIVLRESKGFGGLAATPGAYERVGLLFAKWWVDDDKSKAETIREWFREAKWRVVKII